MDSATPTPPPFRTYEGGTPHHPPTITIHPELTYLPCPACTATRHAQCQGTVGTWACGCLHATCAPRRGTGHSYA